MTNSIQGQTLIELLFGSILFASLLPILGWGIFALNPGRKIKVGTVISITAIELLLLVIVSFTIGNFWKGLICMLSGGIPLLFLYYMLALYQHRAVFPLRDQYIKDFFELNERKKAKQDSIK